MTSKYTEDAAPAQTHDMGGGPGGQDEYSTWGKTEAEKIRPALEDVLSITRQSTVASYMRPLAGVLIENMKEEVNAPCARYNLRIRLAHQEHRALAEVQTEFVLKEQEEGKVFSDTDRIYVSDELVDELANAGFNTPLTKTALMAHQEILDNIIEKNTHLRDYAIDNHCFYDVCGLIDWQSSHRENRGSPFGVLPFSGQELWGVLGLASEGVDYTLRLGLESAQIPKRFGGAGEGQEKRSLIRSLFRSGNANVVDDSIV